MPTPQCLGNPPDEISRQKYREEGGTAATKRVIAYLNLPARTRFAFPFSLPKWTLIFPINLDVTTCNSRYTHTHTRAPSIFHLRVSPSPSSPSTCLSPCSSFSLACRRARHLFISIIIPVDGGGIS